LADPIISVVIGTIILIGSYRLVKDSLRVLMESSPANVDVAEHQRAIEAFDGVKQVHDIHIWTITPGYEAMSAHLVLAPDCSQQQSRLLLEQVRHLLTGRFGVSHMTVQLEGEDAECVEAHVPGVAKGLG
jgi:cobalt-zinc-cadmium efflux system protein